MWKNVWWNTVQHTTINIERHSIMTGWIEDYNQYAGYFCSDVFLLRNRRVLYIFPLVGGFGVTDNNRNEIIFRIDSDQFKEELKTIISESVDKHHFNLKKYLTKGDYERELQLPDSGSLLETVLNGGVELNRQGVGIWHTLFDRIEEYRTTDE